MICCRDPFLRMRSKRPLWDLMPMVPLVRMGCLFFFYQTFWDLIKKYFMALVRDFERGKLDLSRINFSIVTLLPKIPGARQIKDFRPISLSNCSINFFTKAMTNRVY